MSSTAISVRPGLPPRPGGGLIADSLRGVTGVGASTSCAPVHGATAVPAKKLSSAFAAQPVRSLPTTEWPVKGTTSTVAPGIRAATSSALELGVLRSWAPERISVGTSGSGAAGGGGADA